MHKLHAQCMKYYPIIGRVLVGIFFFGSGVSKFMSLEKTGDYIEYTGLPFGFPLAIIAATFLILTAGALMLGYQIQHAALLLAAYTVLVTALFHGPHLWPTEQMMFMKNIAILGGLLWMATYGDNSGCSCDCTSCEKRPETGQMA